MSRQQRLAAVFVELADTLVEEFDVIEFLHVLTDRSVELLDADATGLMLIDQRGQLRVLAASSEQARLLELFELQNSEGPCLDCYTTGHPVTNVSLEDAAVRWPNFTARLTQLGYRSVHALPLRLRSEVIGAMNLFCTKDLTLSEDDLTVGQALADISTIGLLQERAVRQREVLSEQLQFALNSRVLIEQAKGVLAERMQVDVADAFALMRDHSRASNRKLGEVAQAVIDGSLEVAALQPADVSPPRS